MALDDLVKKIISDAEAEAEKVDAQAKVEAQLIIKEAKTEASQKQSAMLDLAKTEAELRSKKEVVTARLEARNAILAQKQALIKQASDQALKYLLNLKAAEYEHLLTRMINEASEGGEEVILNERDHAVGEKMISILNGKNLSLSNETRPISGGFILRKGGIENNYSFETMISIKEEELQSELIKVLFANGTD